MVSPKRNQEYYNELVKLRNDLKDWQIAKEAFGKNGKEECKMIKHYRKAVYSEKICEGTEPFATWFELRTQEEIDKDEAGMVFPAEVLE